MKKAFLVITFFIVYHFSYSQDPQLSLFASSPLAINPAETGSNGIFRLSGNYSKQWANYLNRGTTTSSLSFDIPIPESIVGLGVLIQNSAGYNGAINDLSGMFSLGLKIPLSEEIAHTLALGVQAGIKQKGFYTDKLLFDNQYIPELGFIPKPYDTVGYSDMSVMAPDFNVGAMYYINDIGVNPRPWVGVAAYHVSEPDMSFYDTTQSKLPTKLVVNAGITISTSEYFSFSPSLLFTSQADSTQFTVGGMLNYFPNSETKFHLGTFYRKNNAFVGLIGLGFGDLSFIFDYEMSLPYLRGDEFGSGVFNISMNYIYGSKKPYNGKYVIF